MCKDGALNKTLNTMHGKSSIFFKREMYTAFLRTPSIAGFEQPSDDVPNDDDDDADDDKNAPKK